MRCLSQFFETASPGDCGAEGPGLTSRSYSFFPPVSLIRNFFEMVLPKFFIAGAPKCGTTAMYEYLRVHPQVFMSREKEPHYFMQDEPVHCKVDGLEEYLDLFSAAQPLQHLAVGEASVWYLRSKVALPLIKEFNPEARILLFFRNPVDFVQSIHSQLSFNAGRDPDFPAAWSNEKTRAKLISMGSFGEQLARAYTVFPRAQVLTGLLDDIRANPRQEYLRALAFLGLEDDGRTTFQIKNSNKVHRVPWLARFAKKTPRPIKATWDFTKQVTGIRRLGLMKRVYQLNTKPVKRSAISKELRASIVSEFAQDIALLQEQLGRDLGHWK